VPETNVLTEFLVEIGFVNDEQAQKKFVGAIREGSMEANLLTDSLEKAGGEIAKFAKDLAAHFDQLYLFGRQLRIPAGEIKALQTGFEEVGISVATTNAGLASFVDHIKRLRGYESILKNRFGITSKDQGIQFEQLLVKLHEMEFSGNEKQQMLGKRYQEMFGIPEELVINIDEAEKHIKAYEELVKNLSINTEKFTEDSHKLEVAYRDIETTFKTWGMSILENTGFLETLAPAIDKVNEAIKKGFKRDHDEDPENKSFWFNKKGREALDDPNGLGGVMKDISDKWGETMKGLGDAWNKAWKEIDDFDWTAFAKSVAGGLNKFGDDFDKLVVAPIKGDAEDLMKTFERVGKYVTDNWIPTLLQAWKQLGEAWTNLMRLFGFAASTDAITGGMGGGTAAPGHGPHGDKGHWPGHHGNSPGAESTPAQDAHAKDLMGELQKLGYSRDSAAMFAGQAQSESKLNYNTPAGDSGHAHDLMQWRDDNGRWQGFQAFSASHPELQGMALRAGYIDNEVKKHYGAIGAKEGIDFHNILPSQFGRAGHIYEGYGSNTEAERTASANRFARMSREGWKTGPSGEGSKTSHGEGTISLDGQTFHYGSGGPESNPKTPPGDYNISGAFDPNARGGKGGFHVDDYFDPAVGRMRRGIEIHESAKDDIEQIKTLGCLAIPASEWPAFKKKLAENLRQAGGHASLHIDKEGNATIGEVKGAVERRSDSSEDKTAGFRKTLDAIKRGSKDHGNDFYGGHSNVDPHAFGANIMNQGGDTNNTHNQHVTIHVNGAEDAHKVAQLVHHEIQTAHARAVRNMLGNVA